MNEYIEEAIYVSHDDKLTDIYDKERIICEGFFQDGREEGIEQGSHDARLEIARNLKHAGINSQIIAENTGLTLEQIERL